MRQRLLGAGLAAAIALPALAADDAAQFALGRQLFTGGATPACKVCHTLQDAGSDGQIGPVLDEIKPDADRVATTLRNGVKQMPSYRKILSEAQILALARYVSQASGGAR